MEERLGTSVRLDDGKVEEVTTGLDRGAGVRVGHGTSFGYAYSNRLDREALLHAAEAAAASVGDGGPGEVVDLRRRAAMLSEGAEVIDRLMSGDVTGIDGEHYRVDGVSMQPTPVQRPRVPLWFAARTTNRAPLRRAARYDGMCVIELDPDQLRGAVEFVAGERGGLDRFDVAMMIAPGAELSAR